MSDNADVLEKEIEKKLRKEVKKLHGLCIKFVSPGFNGVPDRIVLLPGKRIYFVECKRPVGGQLSALQRVVHKMFAIFGFPVFCIFNEDDILSFLVQV